MWTGILAAEAFAILSTSNRQKGYSPAKLKFGRNMVLSIKHRVYWELIRQLKQTQVNRDTPERINIELNMTMIQIWRHAH